MRVLVTGSRALSNHLAVYRELDAAYEEWDHERFGDNDFIVVHGAAPGADTFAGQWVWDHRMIEPTPQVEVHPAQWHVHGKAAGPIRNNEMVTSGIDLVLAFFQPGSRNAGTRNCVEQANTFIAWKGVPIKEFWS